MISVSLMACQNERKSVNTADTTSLVKHTDLSVKYDSVVVYSKNIITNENTKRHD